MNARSDRLWERFLEYASLARAKPTFDLEEREWKLEVAAQMQEVLRAARDGNEWRALVKEVYAKQISPRHYASTWAHSVWLRRMLEDHPEALRASLATFLEPNIGAEARFRDFVNSLEEAADETGGVAATPAITLGSVCNFALEPLSLPMVRPGLFSALESLLGYSQFDAESISSAYSGYLSFARWLRRRMEEAGFPIRDMLDVQSLIFIAVQERDFWEGERLHPIGAPPPRPRPESAEEEGVEGSRAYLSICAHYRDEAPYLREWIEFHRLVGVEHFYLYDNQSTDSHRTELAPYLDEGIVTLYPWEPVPPFEPDIYADFLSRHREDSRWVAFLDLDEFLLSPTGQTVPEVLAEYEPWPAIGVNLATFGRSGHVTKPPGLVIENYLMRSDTPWDAYIKMIVDPSRVIRPRSTHEFIYESLLAVDENHYPIQKKLYKTKSVSTSRLRVNHYVTKSDEEAREKLDRPAWTDSRIWRATRWEDRFPTEVDREITRYVPAVRAALSARSAPAGSPQQVQPA